MSRSARDGLRWGGSLGLALLLHAGLVGGGLWWHARSAPLLLDAQPMEAVMVDLAPAPEAPPAPPTEIPPGPPQQEQARPEPEPAPTPEPKIELPPDVVPEVIDPYQPPQTEQQDDPSDEANVDRTLAPPDVQAASAARYAARQTTSGTSGRAAVTWQGLLLGHLEKYRRYPRSAERRRDEGVTYVRFSVDREGNAHEVRIGRSSGHPLLDEETLATVQRATPVPPPPPDLEGERIEVMVPVEFFIRRR